MIIDGQRELLAAAERAGVHRMIPSDFSINGYGYGVNILSAPETARRPDEWPTAV